MARFQVVLLDAGGTIMLGIPTREERLRQACHHFQLSPIPNDQDLRHAIKVVERFFIDSIYEGRQLDRQTVREAVLAMLKAIGIHGKLDEPALIWDFVETQYETEVLMDGAVDILVELKEKGYCLVIASNAPPTYERRLKSLGILDLVDFVFLSDVIGYAKPDPSFFRFILDQLKIDPSKAVHIGNSFWHDVIGAQRAKITPVFFDWREIMPDYNGFRITDLIELPILLANI